MNAIPSAPTWCPGSTRAATTAIGSQIAAARVENSQTNVAPPPAVFASTFHAAWASAARTTRPRATVDIGGSSVSPVRAPARRRPAPAAHRSRGGLGGAPLPPLPAPRPAAPAPPPLTGRGALGARHPLDPLAPVRERPGVERLARARRRRERGGEVVRHLDRARSVIGRERDFDGVAGRDAGGLAVRPRERKAVGLAVSHDGAAPRVAVDGHAHRRADAAEDGRDVERDDDEHAAALARDGRLEGRLGHGGTVPAARRPARRRTARRYCPSGMPTTAALDILVVDDDEPP